MRKTVNASSLDLYKQSVAEWFTAQGIQIDSEEGHKISQKTIDIIATTIFARREEIQQILVELVLKGTNDKYLIDYNYNIEFVMSSSSSQKVASPLLVLELLL